MEDEGKAEEQEAQKEVIIEEADVEWEVEKESISDA